MIKDKEQRTVAQLWATYHERVLPVNAHPVQIRECRRAFYAGCECILIALLAAVGGDDTPDEVGMKYLDERHDEIKRFVNDVKLGRA